MCIGLWSTHSHSLTHSFCSQELAQFRKQLESEKLARHIAEANVNEADKVKTMLKEEVRQLVHRHEKVREGIREGVVGEDLEL